jgi:hypothetical protein
MPEDDDKPNPANAMASVMATIFEMVGPVIEATEGYRTKLESLGYPDSIARKMAGDYHAALLRMVIK